MSKLAGAFPLFIALTFARPAFAGSGPELTTTTRTETETVPIDIFETQSSYVFESDLNHGGSFGKQFEAENDFEYGHRFQISGNLYVHAGVAYDRFDFGNTSAPVPVHLQSGVGVIGLDYMHGQDVGAF